MVNTTDNECMTEVKPTYDELLAKVAWFEQQRSEQTAALTLSARQQDLLDSIPDIIAEVDQNKMFTWVNRAGVEFYGEEVVGREVASYFEGEQDTYDVVAPVFAGSDAVIRVESWQRRKDGEKRLLAWWCRGRKDGDGNVIGAFSSAQDVTEHKQAEEALRESEEKFRTLFESSSAAMAIVERDTTVSMVNREYCRLSGDREQDVIGLSWTRWIVPEDLPRLMEYNRQRVTDPQSAPDHYEFKFYRRDGAVRDALMSVTVIPTSQKILCSFVDITERKRAEDELRRSKNLLDATGQMAKVGGWEVDLATQEVSWTDEVCRIHGVEPGHRLKLDEAVSFYAPESRPAVEAAIKRCAATGEPWDLESCFIPAGSKDKIWVRSLGKAVYGGNEIAGLAGTFQNIDKDKRAEEAQRDSQKRFQALVETTSDFIWEMDSRGVYTYCSPHLETLWGLQPKEMLGKSPFDLLPPEDREQAIGGFAALAASAAPFSNMEMRSFDGAGQIRFLEISGVPFFDLAGRLSGYRGITRDVTERKQLQAAASQADRLASMGLLAAGVAHEINNPLAYVLFNVESLAEDIPKIAAAAGRCAAALHDQVGDVAFAALVGDAAEVLRPAMLEDAVDRAREAVEGSQRIKALTRSLSTFARVDKAKETQVDLKHAIEPAIAMAQNEIKFRARLVKDLSPVPTVWASEGKLSQVFLNLLINAAHAIDEGHVEDNSIKIRTWSAGRDVFAEVADTGKGIPPEELAHVFEPFFSTKQIGKGSGLGLTICKNLVTEFGGDIQVESEVGKGTRFVVRLPAKREVAERRDDATASETAPVPQVRGRVLVVDDEPAIRRTVERMLGRAHEVVTAASGMAGREILERDQAFDVILCDLMMPELTGMELHAWLAEHHPALALRVVFITGGIFTSRAAEYLASVSNLQVQKPFVADSLRKLVADMVVAAKSKR